MKQALLILSDIKLGNNIKKFLLEKYKIEVFVHRSSSEAISFLEILPYSNIIVCDEMIGKESTAQKIYEYINQARETLPEDLEVVFLSNQLGKFSPFHILSPQTDMIYLSHFIALKLKIIDEMPKAEIIEKVEPAKEPSITKSTAPEATTIFQLPKSAKTISKIDIANVLNNQNNEIAIDNSIEYFEVDIRLLKTQTDIKFPCNGFTRVKKGDNYEYSLKIEKDSIFGLKDFEKLFNRGIKQIWIDCNDYNKSYPIFTKIFVQNITNLNLNYNDRLLITSDAFEILLKLIKENKIDQNIVEIIKAALPSYDFFTKVENPIILFLNTLKKNKYSYGLMHSTITCLIMHRVYEKFEWSKEYTKNKINYITFFHDLCLGTDKLIKLHHLFHEEKNTLTHEELINIEKHADNIAKLLEKIVKVPKELVALLREHHGAINGIGISENLNLRIYPFTKLLIISEKVSFLILDKIEYSPQKEIHLNDLKEIFKELKPKFEKQGYLEIINEIELSLFKLEI